MNPASPCANTAAIAVLYGIPNCDTVKKARAWLSAHGVNFAFHDFKKQGVPHAALRDWASAAGWETVLNRKGTTWRQLQQKERDGVVDAPSACSLMATYPSLIKRPVVVWPDQRVTVGFNETLFSAHVS